MALATATPNDMKVRYDVNTLGDLVKDDGHRKASSLLSTDDILETLLSSAEGRVRGTILKGGKYTSADLAALTGDSKEYYKDIICRVAWWMLWQRKPWTESRAREEAKQDAEGLLKAIGQGDEIFEVQAVIDAGHVQMKAYTKVEFNDQALIRDVASRFYPSRRTWQNR